LLIPSSTKEPRHCKCPSSLHCTAAELLRPTAAFKGPAPAAQSEAIFTD